jgi:hypothetical protein
MRQRDIAAEISTISSGEGRILFQAFEAESLDPRFVDADQNCSNSFSKGFEICTGKGILFVLSFFGSFFLSPR